MSILNSNLVFGADSYFIHFLSQSIMSGKIPSGFNRKNSKFTYSPIHINDLASAVESALSSSGKSAAYSVNGKDDLNLH